MVLTETKATDQSYCHKKLGCDVVCSLAITKDAGGVQGGSGLIMQDQPKGWSIELTPFHRMSVVICEIIAGVKRTPLIGAYLPPSTLEHLPGIEEALTRFRYQDPIATGDLNTDIFQSQNLCRHQVEDLLMEFGMVKLLHHFQQR